MLIPASLGWYICYAHTLNIQQPVSTECSKLLIFHLPAAAEAGQGLGAVSVFVGSLHARIPAYHAVILADPHTG